VEFLFHFIVYGSFIKCFNTDSEFDDMRDQMLRWYTNLKINSPLFHYIVVYNINDDLLFT